jgi:hypothetical protein
MADLISADRADLITPPEVAGHFPRRGTPKDHHQTQIPSPKANRPTVAAVDENVEEAGFRRL